MEQKEAWISIFFCCSLICPSVTSISLFYHGKYWIVTMPSLSQPAFNGIPDGIVPPEKWFGKREVWKICAMHNYLWSKLIYIYFTRIATMYSNISNRTDRKGAYKNFTSLSKSEIIFQLLFISNMYFCTEFICWLKTQENLFHKDSQIL